MKIHPVVAELFYADRRTDRQIDGHDEVNSCSSQFCETHNGSLSVASTSKTQSHNTGT